MISALARRGGVPGVGVIQGPTVELTGDLAAGQVHAFTAELPGLTHGEGLLTAEFTGHRPVRGQAPSRRRTDADPRDRRAYLLRVTRETPGRSV